MYKTEGFIDEHIHGAFGVDFGDCEVEDFIDVATEMPNFGVTRFYPTLVTDDIHKIKEQILKIKEAMSKQQEKSALIGGVHLEGPFINPLKKGIHQDKYVLEPSVSEYKKIEDECIKIVTLAPELDNDRKLCKYLLSKGVLVSAGHTLTSDLSFCTSVTHLFNAMSTLNHKLPSTVASALASDDIFVEVIADGNHIIDDVLKIIFKAKSHDKIVLISDALFFAHADEDEGEFCGCDVSVKNGSVFDMKGKLAGSAMLQIDILKRLVDNNILSFDEAVYMMNVSPAKRLNVLNNAFITIDDDFNVVKTAFIH